MKTIKGYGELGYLKSLKEYRKELVELHNEVGISIATGTLIQSDLELIRRWEELLIIISFLEGNLIENNKQIDAVNELKNKEDQ